MVLHPGRKCRSLSSACVTSTEGISHLQYAAGMAAASQTIIVRTALNYQDVYEVPSRIPAGI